MPRTIRFLVTITLAFATTLCIAQPASFLYVSLEALVASGDTVFLGTIDHYDSSPDSGGAQHATFTVRVDSLLKGRVGQAVVLNQATTILNDEPSREAALHTQLLWIVKSGSPSVWSMLDLRDPLPAAKQPAMFPGLPILGIDFKPIRTGSDVLAHVKAFLASAPPSAALQQIIIPWAASKVSERSASYEFMNYLSTVAQPDTPGLVARRLVVPIVPQLEETARQAILHPESLVPLLDASGGRRTLDLPTREAIRAGEIVTLRLSGIRLLANFKSDQNAELLKSFLTDRSIRGFARPGEIGIAKGREYPIRRAAYDLLTRWGIKVDRPVIELSDAPPPLLSLS